MHARVPSDGDRRLSVCRERRKVVFCVAARSSSNTRSVVVFAAAAVSARQGTRVGDDDGRRRGVGVARAGAWTSWIAARAEREFPATTNRSGRDGDTTTATKRMGSCRRVLSREKKKTASSFRAFVPFRFTADASTTLVL